MGLIILTLVACQGVELAYGGDAATTQSEPDDDQLASIYRTIIREMCESTTPPLTCGDHVRVSEEFSGNGVTTTETIPDLVRHAAEIDLPAATFVDPGNWNRSGLLIVLGPSEMPLPDALAIQAGYLCGDLCGQGKTYYFQRDGEAWEQVDAEDLGLPNEIWAA